MIRVLGFAASLPLLGGATCERRASETAATVEGVLDQAAGRLEDGARLLAQVNEEVAAYYRQATTAARIAASIACGVAGLPAGSPERAAKARDCYAAYDRIAAGIEDWFAAWLRISTRLRLAIEDLARILRGGRGDLFTAVLEVRTATVEAAAFRARERPPLPGGAASRPAVP